METLYTAPNLYPRFLKVDRDETGKAWCRKNIKKVFVGMGPQYRNPKPNTPGDSVVLVLDTDGDGKADRTKTFAAGFNAIQGLAWHGRDLWVANAPDLTVVRDLNGDDEADEYVRVFTDLGNLEHGLHGLNWAPDGKLYMISKFVKASGGCSAPAAKDAEEAAKSIGKMQIKKFVSKEGDALTAEAQIMIKHPNTTGMQMDQVTGLYTPARYVNKIEVKSGADVIFSMEGGISISEDPNFRFTHGGKSGDAIEVKAQDSDGASFAGQLAPSQS